MWYKAALTEIKENKQGLGGGIILNKTPQSTSPPVKVDPGHVYEILEKQPNQIGNKAGTPSQSSDPNSSYIINDGQATNAVFWRNKNPHKPNRVYTTTEEMLDAVRHENTENKNSPTENNNQSMSSTENGRGFQTGKNIEYAGQNGKGEVSWGKYDEGPMAQTLW